MSADAGALSKLSALLATLAVALLAAWLLSRQERRKAPRALLPGYPLPEFPRRELQAGPLASLCQTQDALLALYRELPEKSTARPRLLAFLEELRGLMDAAYALAARETPEAAERIARLSQDARRAADELRKSTRRESESGEDPTYAELDVRLEVLRVLARDVDEL